jgi:hypothetical protein
VDGYRRVVEVSREKTTHENAMQRLAQAKGPRKRWYLVERHHLRDEFGENWPNAQELCMCGHILSLWRRDPRYSPAIRGWMSRIVNAEENSVDVGGIVRRCAGSVQFRDGDFNVNGADFVRACILRKGRHRAQFGKVGRHHSEVAGSVPCTENRLRGDWKSRERLSQIVVREYAYGIRTSGCMVTAE